MSNLGNKAIMAKNIQYYMDQYGKSRQDMCDALGVKYTTFTDWVKGNSYPRIDKIELMANYFGISKSDLVEDHKKAQEEKPFYVPETIAAHFEGETFTEEQINQINNFIDFVKSKK